VVLNSISKYRFFCIQNISDNKGFNVEPDIASILIRRKEPANKSIATQAVKMRLRSNIFDFHLILKVEELSGEGYIATCTENKNREY
jgi:hypothetical protein